MAQAVTQQTQNPITNFFRQLGNGGGNQQQNRNGPTNQQGSRDLNQQQNQNVDPKQFKFDPMTGKPVGGGATNNPETQQDPLHAYQDLWKKIEPGKEDQAPQFDLAPDTINAAAEGLDFIGSLPEGLDLTGLGENKDTILQLLNHVGRMSYATSMSHGSKLTGKFTDLRLAHEGKSIPGKIRESMTDYSIASNPAASKNPVVRETLKMAAQNLQKLYPDASPDDIAKMSSGFFTELAKALNPDLGKEKEVKEKEASQAPGGIDFDWSKFAGEERAA